MTQDAESRAIEALRRGDISGLEVLVRLYQRRAMGVAYNLCSNREVAEDVVAESFLAVQRHIASYDLSRPFQPWFYRIVVNSTRAAVARDGRVRTVPDSRALIEDRADPGPGPEVGAVQKELEVALRQQINRLPHKQGEALVLRYFLDLDERTMAGVLGVPIGTVKWRLFQARKTLQRHLYDGQEMHCYLSQEGQRP